MSANQATPGGDGRFLFVVRYIADGSKQLLDDSSNLTRTLARGESLNISKRDRAKLVPSSPARVQVIKLIFRMYAEQGKPGTREAGARTAAG